MSEYNITNYIPIHLESLLKEQFGNAIIFYPIPNKDKNKDPLYGKAKIRSRQIMYNDVKKQLIVPIGELVININHITHLLKNSVINFLTKYETNGGTTKIWKDSPTRKLPRKYILAISNIFNDISTEAVEKYGGFHTIPDPESNEYVFIKFDKDDTLHVYFQWDNSFTITIAKLL